MRVLVTIPHFFRADSAGAPGSEAFYGSEISSRDERRQQVEACLLALHQTFGPRQALMTHPQNYAANTRFQAVLDVVMVTNPADHLADTLPRDLFVQYALESDPRHLGFVCHQLMRENAGRYDYYVYLEDDIAVTDPLFFDKLAWFSETFGHGALLQPNRFECSGRTAMHKLYVDGDTTAPDQSARFQDITQRPVLMGGAFGRTYRFKRVDNVHSGCFFLNAPQLGRLAQTPLFGQPTDAFFGPLESAATLPVMRVFDVYKPAADNAGFLEVRHTGLRFLVPQAEPQP